MTSAHGSPAAQPPGSGGSLTRSLGLPGAMAIGLGSMVGAGVFVAFAPAAAAAGSWLLLGLGLAVVVALCNATSTAQLAGALPVAGGAYAYGRTYLGPWWGFTAGWGFVVGKTASAAAMATAFAVYAVPEPWTRPAAAVAVLVATAVNLRGITRTAAAASVIVTFVLLALTVVLAGTWLGLDSPATLVGGSPGGAYGVLQSAGLLFFALAGYARIATLGEEVKDPRRTLPRAIVLALGVVVALYGLVAVTLLATLGPERLASSSAPLVDAVATVGLAWAGPVVAVAAAVASLGALLAGLAGISRTGLAMARNRDLPGALDAVHPVRSVPHRIEMLVGLVVAGAVLVVDLREIIGFSSAGVLLYYAVANLSALRQVGAERRYPRPVQVVGLIGCLVLVVTLPWQSLAVAAVVLVVGLAGRAVGLRLRTGNT